MVTLPEIPKRLVTSEAPRSSVSPADIASPYQQLAQNLNKAGEVVGDLSVRLAEKEGEEAVSPDGSSIAQPAIPIAGPASTAFARKARFTALARQQPIIESDMLELRLAHPNDPQAFKAAADAYTKQKLDQNTDPLLRGPIEKAAINAASTNYRSSLVQADTTNAQNGKVAITSQISDISNKMALQAYNGGVDTPEYKQWQSDLGALYGELGTDARMGYPKERIASEITELTSQHKTMAIAGQAVRMMDGDSLNGRADAKKWLIDKIYNDPSLNLSLAQRHQAVTTATALMEARSSENKALVDGNKAMVSTLLTQLHTTMPYNPITINDAIATSAKMGDAESYYKLTFAKGMKDWDQAVRSLPLPQQLGALRNLDQMRQINTQAAGTAMTFFQGRGYSKEQAAGIVGNLIQESGLNPNTVHDSGTGLGIAGHRLERLDAMQQFAASKGKPVNDYQTQLEFIDHELQTSESGVGAAVRAAKTPQEAARAFISYERPKGWTAAQPEGGHGYSNRVNNAVALVGGSTGAGEAWFQQARVEQVARTREYLKTQAETYVKTIEAQANKTGDVSDEILRNASAILEETGQGDLKQRIVSAMMAHYSVKTIDELPVNVRQSIVGQTKGAAKDDPIAFQVHEHMAATIEASAKGMETTPYTTWATRRNAPPPAAYNFADPANVEAVASQRAAVQKSFRNNDGTGPTSVFEGREAEAFANTLTNGDPALAAQSLNGLTKLPDDEYEATLTAKPVSTAVVGMMSSRDPARMAAGMSAVDKLWRSSPTEAQAAFGAGAITKLQAWQGLRGSFSPVELAERLNAADDPSTTKARADAKEAAEKETATLAPGDMAYKLGSSWGIPLVSSIANVVTGATPAVPYDSIKGGELVADYRSTYTALRAYGVDADKASDLAVQRLKSSWGISEAAGNQLMRDPPERYYPAIDGSHSWLQKDLTSWVAGKRGAEFAAGTGRYEAGFGGAIATRNWTVAGLVADGQTQAEIASGKPPSYQVAIKRKDGTTDIIESRIAFDPSEHIAEHGARLDERRQRVNFMRTNEFQAGGALP